MLHILRVISGVAGGIRLKTPKGQKTRPTTDRVKETMFNILSPELTGAIVLDLFSGSGSLGIEALSRGAKFALFIDRDRECVGIIRENLKRAKLDGLSEVLCGDYKSVLKKVGSMCEKFNLIFLDPPYDRGLIQEAIEKIIEYEVVEDSALFVIERSKEEELPQGVGRLVRQEQFGQTMLSFLRKV